MDQKELSYANLFDDDLEEDWKQGSIVGFVTIKKFGSREYPEDKIGAHKEDKCD